MINPGYLKVLIWILAIIAIVGSTFKILKEYERGVVFRLGKLKSTKGPGLILLIPFIDRIKRVDLRLVSIDVPRQDIMTMDNVPVTVDAVVYFHIIDPAVAIITIQNIEQSTFLIAQATLRNVLGQLELDDLLSQQSKINQRLQEILSLHTKQWGIHVSIVEIKEVTLPEQMKRAMAKQAETERERRARLIDAQGEYQASKTLAEAGRILSENPQGLQLRYLQTLRDISTNKGSTVLFPLPIDLLSPFFEGIKKVIIKEKTKDEDTAKERIEVNDPYSKTDEVEVKSEEIPSPQKDLGLKSVISPFEGVLTKYKDDLAEGRLTPQYAQWVITDNCQSSCSHCEIVAKKVGGTELDTSFARGIIDDLKELGCKYLFITGGEPMLRKDLFEIIGNAKDRGLSIGLTTNGQATEENLSQLVDSKIDSVILTIDGYGDTLNKIRDSKDAYLRCLRSIEFFRDIGVPKVYACTILLDKNMKDLPRMTEDIFRSGAGGLQIQPQIFEGGKPMRNPSSLVKEVFRFILEARRRGFPVEAGEQFGFLGPLEPLLRTSPFFCGCGWNTFCITSDGKILGCPTKSGSSLEEGDLKADSLQNIWQKGFSQFRRDLPEGLQEGCSRCPHLSACRGGCWLFRVQGLNPCFLLEAEEIYREITNAGTLYNKTT